MLNIKALVSDASCYEKIRELRWPNGVCCPRCDSPAVIKRGKDDKQKERQRYECKTCRPIRRFNGNDFRGPSSAAQDVDFMPLLHGLNLSNQQIGAELDLNKDDVQSMTSQCRAPGYDRIGGAQEKLPIYLGFFEFVHNMKNRGKSLLQALLQTLVS